jgi:hypothetical protein
MKKSRTLLAAAAAVAGLVAFAGPAQAAPPENNFEQFLPGTDTLGGDGYCQFPVQIEGINKEIGHDVGKPHNQITGLFAVTVTGNDKTLKYNISGPGTVTGAEDGSFTIDAQGPSLLWTTLENSSPEAGADPIVPQLAYTTGPVHVEVDANGNTTSYTLTSGRSIDVCALLADS